MRHSPLLYANRPGARAGAEIAAPGISKEAAGSATARSSPTPKENPRTTVTHPSRYDAILIGAGQTGEPLARALAGAGQRVLLIERDRLGGTCTNRGCTPTKTLVFSAYVADLVRRAGDYGVQIPGPSSVDIARVLARKDALVRDFREAVRENLTGIDGLELAFGEARLTDRNAVLLHERDGRERTLTAGRIILNVGARPAVPPIEGLSDVPFLDSTTILSLETLPEHLLVLGGGYIGLEFAQMFRRFGSRVTIIEANPHLLGADEDDDVTGEMARLLREDRIDVRLNTKAERVRGTAGDLRLTVRAEDGPATEALRGTHLLVATGRTPNTNDLGLDAAGVETDERGYIKVNERLETSVPGIWAGGDAAGSPAFTHIAYDDFRVLRSQLIGDGSRTTRDRLVPQTVFTDPQLGRVGMSEKQARVAGKNVRIAKVSARDLARPRETGEARGFLKAVVDADTDEILGCAMFCREGGEMMGAVTVALMAKLPYTALRDGIFSHPTLVESLNNLFLSLDEEGKGR